MEALVRVVLAPQGVWTTPWQADSLLGSLACVWARKHGAAALQRDFLDPWVAGEPPFVLSDAFPGDGLPMPAATPVLWDWPPEQRKVIKRTKWLTSTAFASFQHGRRPELNNRGMSRRLSSIQHHVRLRNTVARSRTSGSDAIELYEVPYSTLSDPEAGLAIFARASSSGRDVLIESLEILGLAGYGADASVGHGGFSIENVHDSWPGLDDVPDADGFVSLSTYQPGVADPVDGYWRAFVKYGKMAPEFHGSAIFKRPQMMLKPGACFRTGECPKPFYGAPIGPDDLLATRDRTALASRGVAPVQAAFCLAVPMKWPTEGME